MIPPVLRQAAIFSTVAGLGFALAWMLGAAEVREGRPRPSVPVVPLPTGTALQGSGGVAGISLVKAARMVVAPVQVAVLEDGTRAPFRSVVLRGDGERPLPSPGEGVSRALIVNPDLQFLPVPRTRAEYAASSGAEPTRIGAPEGVLDSGPGDRMSVLFRGGMKARSWRKGTPWDFTAEEAVSDVQARTLRAAGAVSLVSSDLKVEGRDLEASETASTIVLGGGASGSVESARGVRIAGGRAGGTTRFRCRGPFRILPLPSPGGAGATVERWRLVLEEDAVIEQEDGTIAGRRIEADITRPKEGSGGETSVDEVRADGSVVLTGRGEGREFRATGESLRAVPQAKGNTDAWLDGSPAVHVREGGSGTDARTLEVHGDGLARLGFPAGDGPVAASFRGGARAVLLEPSRRRDLRATNLSLAGMRSGSGTTRVEAVVAEGEAVLEDGDRTARAGRIEFRPAGDGASRTSLDGDVLFSWPAAGAMDPITALAPAADAPSGTMLLSTPGRAVIEQPADGDPSTGTRFTVEGGAVLRRVAGEQEVYRLACSSIDARTPPGRRGLDHLSARGDVRLSGRGEGPAGRAYDLRGDALDVRGSPGSGEARTAEVTGAAERPAAASFTREDGHPFRVNARTLRFDRETGGFTAEGAVRANGILPEGRSGGLPAGGGGAADLACGVLEGVLARGAAERSTRVVSLDAREEVWIRTATEYASGDALAYAEREGTLLLRGDPARVTARTQGAVKGITMEDRCDAKELLLLLKDGRLQEARADSGGLLVRHGTGKAAPERIQARCTGPLSYRPEETCLQGNVTVEHAELKDGAFVPKDRIEGADEVRVYHTPVAGQAARVERVTASSAAGRIALTFDSGEFTASGVSRTDMDAVQKRITLESSQGAPRFRIRTADTVGTCRRATYDYAGMRLVDSVAMTVESGK